ENRLPANSDPKLERHVKERWVHDVPHHRCKQTSPILRRRPQSEDFISEQAIRGEMPQSYGDEYYNHDTEEIEREPFRVASVPVFEAQPLTVRFNGLQVYDWRTVCGNTHELYQSTHL